MRTRSSCARLDSRDGVPHGMPSRPGEGKRKGASTVMGSKMRLLWPGITVLGLLCLSATAGNACNTESGGPLYNRPLYNNGRGYAEALASRKSEPPGILKYDNIIYYVQFDSRRLFAIDLTNDSNVEFARGATSKNVTNNGIWATEYRQDGGLDERRR